MQPPWTVLGLGAVGSWVAASAAHRGYPMTALTSTSMRVVHLQGIGRYTIHAENRRDIQRLIVATKAHQAKDAIQSVIHKLYESCTIVLMCNGLLALQDELEPILPNTMQIVYASNTHGVKVAEDRSIVHTGKGIIKLGSMDNDNPNIQQIANDLETQTGLNWIADSSIKLTLFQKLAANACINAATALLNCRNGDLLAHGLLWKEFVHKISLEVCDLAKKKNLTLIIEELEEYVSKVALHTASNTSSMLADVLAGRKTEIEYINGYIARNEGVYNSAIHDLLRMRENDMLKRNDRRD
jgi:2-dehydropantoate 2-reductase